MLCLNGHPIPITLFPDKTSQVWKLGQELLSSANYCDVLVTWKFEHEGEFLHLAQLKALLDHSLRPAVLHLPYLPYGRQDKPVSDTGTFGLVAFAKLLNALAFKGVLIHDPHSQVAVDLINNAEATYPIAALDRALIEHKSDIVCYPDRGAKNKYTSVYTWPDYTYGHKVRDQLTGAITEYRVVGDSDGKRVMIVDDICDGGATFTALAKLLYEQGAKDVALFVTHGIFSKGLTPLRDSGIHRIFTSNGEVT